MFGEKKKSVIPVIIAILLLVVFFVSTRDYEKFKLLDKEVKDLDPRLEPVVQATKECNSLDNETYKARCYSGVGYAAGYHNFEDYDDLCSSMISDTFKIDCYKGAGARIGEEFYGNMTEMFQRCEKSPDWARGVCKENALARASRIITKQTKSWEHCELMDSEYKNACYLGVGWGLGDLYYPDSADQLKLVCDSLKEYKLACLLGTMSTISLYQVENPSFIETVRVNTLSKWDGQSAKMKDFFESITARTGYYAGIKYYGNLDTAFSICENFTEGFGESARLACKERIFQGFGFSSYSKLVNQSWSP